LISVPYSASAAFLAAFSTSSLVLTEAIAD
jgi:hypothetical protein